MKTTRRNFLKSIALGVPALVAANVSGVTKAAMAVLPAPGVQQIAVALGDQAVSAQERIEQFTTMLSRQSPRLLDTLGISAAQVRARISDLAQDGADRKQARISAVMDEARENLRYYE